MQPSLTLIKLGGSIITDKERSQFVRTEVLQRLVSEIAQAQKVTGDLIVIGHGQGGFAHLPAQKYDTMNGFLNDDSRYGMAVTQDSAAQLNRIVVAECLRQNLPAVSYLMSNSLVTKNRVAEHWDATVLKTYFAQGLLPITCGDVIVDNDQGCTIWSTEEILTFLAEYFHKHGQPIRKIIHVTEVPGVLDQQQQVVPEISLSNQEEVRSMMTSTKGTDVTGGMWHKIQESLDLAEHGIESVILGGLEPENLYNAMVGQAFTGTVIPAEAAKTKLPESEFLTEAGSSITYPL